MKLSPLKVLHYHFVAFSVFARPDTNIEDLVYDSGPYPLMEESKLITEVLLGEPDGVLDPNQFVVNLSLSYDIDENTNFPYSFAISLEGVFAVDHSGDIQERKSFVVCNGASILYGAAREQLLTLTARHKFGPILLPCANFRGLAPSTECSPVECSSEIPTKKSESTRNIGIKRKKK